MFAAVIFLAAGACSSSHEQLPNEQIRSLTSEPKLISDKLFVLEEFQIGTRERALAEIVFEKTTDPEVKELAKIVREGHQLGIDKLRTIAAELKVDLPNELALGEKAKLDVIKNLPPDELARYFLIHQRAIHAWDTTIFADFANFAVNEQLQKYVRETLPPLRLHSEQVTQLAESKGIREK